MTEQAPLRALKEGDTFNGFLLAQEVAFKTSAKGSEYLELKLADASGDLKAFLWDLRAIEGDMDQVAPDVFLKVKGQVSLYNRIIKARVLNLPEGAVPRGDQWSFIEVLEEKRATLDEPQTLDPLAPRPKTPTNH